jgi:hypothetical protein
VPRTRVLVHLGPDLLVLPETHLSPRRPELSRLVLVRSRAGNAAEVFLEPVVLGDGVAATALQPGFVIVLELLVGLR